MIGQMFVNRSALVPEFARIACISVAFVTEKGEVKMQSFSDIDEKKMLLEVQKLLHRVGELGFFLCGHNVKGFDIPWVLHKMNKYNIEPPKLLDIYGKKPWEIPVFDLADEWKQQGRTSVSLNEVAYELGVNTDMDDIDGREVHKTYWKDNDMMKIKNHCENDVLNSMRIAERMLKYKMI